MFSPNVAYSVASALALLSLVLVCTKTGAREDRLMEPNVAQDVGNAIVEEGAFILFSGSIACALFFSQPRTNAESGSELPPSREKKHEGTLLSSEQHLPGQEDVRPNLARELHTFHAHVRNKNILAAEEVLRRFPQLPHSCYRLLVRIHCKNMHPTSAEPWIAKMNAEKHDIDVHLAKALVHSYAKSNQPEKAEMWLEGQFRDGEADLVSLSVVLNAYGRLGNVTKIEEWLQKARAYGLTLNKIIYSTIINACSKTADIAKAEAWFIELQKDDIEPDQIIWNTMIKTCARAGDLDKMNDWFQRMIKSGFQGNIVTYTSVIQALSKTGDVTRGKAALQEMRDIGIVPDQIVYNALLHGCEISADVAHAEKIVKMVVADGLKLDRVGYRSIVRTVAKKSANRSEVEYWGARMQRLGIRHVSVNVREHEVALPA